MVPRIALAPAYPYYLAGEALAANSDLAVTDKFTGEICTRVALGDPGAIDRAISKAVEAVEACRKMPSHARAGVLHHVVRRLAEACRRVNASRYGLQAGVFTRNIDSAFYAFNELDVGGVIVNDVPSFRVDNMPYGGVKDSGLGREGVRFAIEEMTERRLLVLSKVGRKTE